MTFGCLSRKHVYSVVVLERTTRPRRKVSHLRGWSRRGQHRWQDEELRKEQETEDHVSSIAPPDLWISWSPQAKVTGFFSWLGEVAMTKVCEEWHGISIIAFSSSHYYFFFLQNWRHCYNQPPRGSTLWGLARVYRMFLYIEYFCNTIHCKMKWSVLMIVLFFGFCSMFDEIFFFFVAVSSAALPSYLYQTFCWLTCRKT